MILRKTLLAMTLTLASVSALADATKVFALDENQCTPPPAAELRGDPSNGQALHVEHCAACHGANGRSEVVVMHMDETPQDQSDTDYMKNLPDVYLYLAICKGGEGVAFDRPRGTWT